MFSDIFLKLSDSSKHVIFQFWLHKPNPLLASPANRADSWRLALDWKMAEDCENLVFFLLIKMTNSLRCFLFPNGSCNFSAHLSQSTTSSPSYHNTLTSTVVLFGTRGCISRWLAESFHPLSDQVSSHKVFLICPYGFRQGARIFADPVSLLVSFGNS